MLGSTERASLFFERNRGLFFFQNIHHGVFSRAGGILFFSFRLCQYREIWRVAIDSHSRFWATLMMSTVAKCFGELWAGFPSGISILAATSWAMSCSWNPKTTATSAEVRRAGRRRPSRRSASSSPEMGFLVLNITKSVTPQ